MLIVDLRLTYTMPVNMNNFLKELRFENLELKKEKRHLQNLFNKAVKSNNKLKKLLSQSEQICMQLKEKNENLIHALKQCQSTPDRPERKRKSWSQIKCEHTKRKRVSQFGEYVLTSIKNNIDECQGADLTLSIGSEKLNYQWKSKHFKDASSNSDPVPDLSHLNDHTYVKDFKRQPDRTEDPNSVDYSEIFDDDGNWRIRHIRKIINVMDKFRISHEAYHELRMSSKSKLPPIGQIVKEKIIMSECLPYEKHPTVS